MRIDSAQTRHDDRKRFRASIPGMAGIELLAVLVVGTALAIEGDARSNVREKVLASG